MFRKSNSILVKAVAMGTLLTSGGIATDGDDKKESKKFDAPLYGSTTHGGTTETRTPSMGTENRDVHRSLVEPPVRNILSNVDARLEMRRELLRKPIKVDLRGALVRGEQAFDKIVKTLLADAKKYDVPLKLTLVNATETELNGILSYEGVQFDAFDFTYATPLIDDMNAYDLTEINDNNTEEWIDDSLTLTATDDADEEWIDEPLTLTANELEEEWIDDPAALLMGGGPYAGLPRFRRAAAARAMHAPLLPELVERLGQKGVVAPPQRIIDDTDGSLDNRINELHPSAWNITLVKDVEGQKNPNSQGLGQFNNLGNHVSHNLVHIFCRENRVQS
ncbi:MAG: hypothetical protein ACOH2E_05595 [Candidatus Paracaedibacter sp.]